MKYERRRKNIFHPMAIKTFFHRFSLQGYAFSFYLWIKKGQRWRRNEIKKNEKRDSDGVVVHVAEEVKVCDWNQLCEFFHILFHIIP